MSALVYTLEKRFDGPWLLSRDALLDLDRAMDGIYERFEIDTAQLIEEEIEQSIKGNTSDGLDEKRMWWREQITPRMKLRRSAKLMLSHSKYIQDETLEDLLANPELHDEAPIGIEVEVYGPKRNARLQLRAGLFENAALRIAASPETAKSAREAFSALQHWAMANQAPTWQRVWRRITGFHWFVWLVLVVLLSQAVPTQSEVVEEQLRVAAREMLMEGISDEEVASALELLVRFHAKEAPQELRVEMPSWFAIIVFGGLFVCAMLSICPNLVLGIGRSKSRLGYWRTWLKFVGVTVPSVVFLSFVWPHIVEWLKRVF